MSALGELRPSQFIFTFGVGALLDLPQLSVMILGLQDWNERYSREINEDRLLAALQRRLGRQVSRLLLPPIPPDDQQKNPAAPPIGVPVVPFPRWLRCPKCQTMGSIESGLFQLIQDQYRPDRTRFIHQACTKAKAPTALPMRFLLACRDGHLTDFPWIEFVHDGKAICKPVRLSMYEFGPSGDVLDIMIKCHSCNKNRSMSEAFNPGNHFSCPGHHPHLRQINSDGCPEPAKPILLGASNSWFPQIMSVLSIPAAGDDALAQLIEDQWAILKNAVSLDMVKFAVATIPMLKGHSAEHIWQAIQDQHQRNNAAAPDDDVADLKVPEWAVFAAPDDAPQGSDFKLTRVAPPQGFTVAFADTVRVERLREVRALFGFNRLESNGDFTDATFSSEGRYTPLSAKPPTWLPATEVRGEGLFLRLKEEEVVQWEARPAVQALEAEFHLAHRHWRKLRHIDLPDADFPGIRYVLIHSLAHALMRQIALDCGYTAASLRERLYCRRPGDLHGPMAGFLLYTAASDSEGTLGGLVELGNPLTLGRHLHQALENLRICASDPLCAEHAPSKDGRGIHAASCHACLFSPETSCERGNRYLDRSVLLPTLSRDDTAFFTL